MKLMVKLPKEMQKKEKARPKRAQMVKKREGGSQFSSRQMRRKMQQQGIDMEPIEATRVIIEQPNQTLVIEEPEIVLMKQAGQEIYQVIGEAVKLTPDQVTINAEQPGEVIESIHEEEIKPTITEEDIMLVAAQSNVDKKEAEAALIEHQGDIAKAILFLKNRT